jgi:hypothetical protein
MTKKTDKNRTPLDVELTVKSLKGNDYPMLKLEFPDDGERYLKTFDPKRLYLEDSPGNRYSLTDPEGHRYCGVEKHEFWTVAAEKTGLFFLVMLGANSATQDTQILGRILVIRYPFGQILRDTEIFRTGSQEFAEALQDGRLIRKAIRDLKPLAFAGPPSN